MNHASFLRVRDLTVRFSTEGGPVRAVNGISFEVDRGRTLGIVGESGSGKSVTSLSVLGLHNPARTTITGEIWVGDRQVVGLDDKRLRELRGREMAMIFQDPLSALHPAYTVGRQIVEAYRAHQPSASRAEARRRAVEMLGRVGIPRPAERFGAYPHEFSGGMRQRVMIAMALVNDPSLLIADEPTTALDVTVQAQILDLLAGLQDEFDSAIILITHDLGVVGRIADDVLVMYGGRIVERGSVEQVLRRPQHPYTWGLLASMPTLRGDPETELVPIPGTPPSLTHLPDGCAFHPRCRYTGERSRTEVPELLPTSETGHLVACHLPEAVRRSAHV
ncbi:dipeptide/oligopeptide/nickel ABC transporter ATP-binding protein [Actinoplanes ianthinogenes]|uniref:Dipeptide/oligopeptide/nickel ABC transporter ATP-binding protein n=1 Tax=Actinoplanes ianthinogenes TaxID=122358 RepID=A0ABM7M671_9ACTN|nr:ABC transporter ATP-binding protein [Actinoplanes ianthinogenes]BCJ47119.1 dipeptide/oligopeptide/nickel ABC transporter ATP-binding protein [Actinoplanes ianthinogenes]GGR51827.1 dipeptide/oligopeptide/nickel ABC transporter ATP-binding protein [Actinoplanes ianthinogenes]